MENVLTEKVENVLYSGKTKSDHAPVDQATEQRVNLTTEKVEKREETEALDDLFGYRSDNTNLINLDEKGFVLGNVHNSEAKNRLCDDREYNGRSSSPDECRNQQGNRLFLLSVQPPDNHGVDDHRNNAEEDAGEKHKPEASVRILEKYPTTNYD